MIDFAAEENAETYSGREAHSSWSDEMRGLVDPRGLEVVDLGCGGGIYSKAWLRLGASCVTGIDSSAPILSSAAEGADSSYQGLRFQRADVRDTGLPSGSADVVFARALVHHLPDLADFVAEATRLLRPGGRLIIQDRTVEDVSQPPGTRHVRGHFFSAVPRLLDVESARRPDDDAVVSAIDQAGCEVRRRTFWEVRGQHPTRGDLLEEIAERKGRSILHELDDVELQRLLDHLAANLPEGEILEMDRWTIWFAEPHQNGGA